MLGSKQVILPAVSLTPRYHPRKRNREPAERLVESQLCGRRSSRVEGCPATSPKSQGVEKSLAAMVAADNDEAPKAMAQMPAPPGQRFLRQDRQDPHRRTPWSTSPSPQKHARTNRACFGFSDQTSGDLFGRIFEFRHRLELILGGVEHGVVRIPRVGLRGRGRSRWRTCGGSGRRTRGDRR